MNTSASTPFTPLESLFLLRGILSKGLSTAAFTHISHVLTDNSFIKDEPTYDAQRLTPESLKAFFLHLIREELKDESEPAPASSPRPDGGLSPASKRRRLQPPPVPTLRQIRHQHLDKVIDIANRLEAVYRDEAIRSIRLDEARYDQLQSEIAELEQEEQRPAEEGTAPGQDGAAISPKELRKGKSINGSRSPPTLPRPQAIESDPTSPPQSGTSKPNTEAPSPAAAHQEAPRSPQQGPSPVRLPSEKPLESPQPPNGTPVLQAPQGVSPFPPHVTPTAAPTASPVPATGIQRSDGAGRLKQSQASPAAPASQAQAAGQSQLSWQPPYQPPRPLMQHPGHRPLQPSPVPQRNQPGSAQQRPQVPVQPAAQPLQSSPQQPQSVLMPPQSTGQLPLQPAASRPAGDIASDLTKRPPPQSVPIAEQGHAQATAHPQSSHEAPPRPGQFQSPPIQTQAPQLHQSPDGKTAPRTLPPSPPAAPRQAETHQGVSNTPHNPLPPRPAIPLHLQRVPSPQLIGHQASRAQPSTPARQTSLAILTNGGSGTKWKSTPTPSTPKPSPTGRDGVVDSPAVEPLSPGRTFSNSSKSTAPRSSRSRPQGQREANEPSTASVPKRRGRPPRTAQAAATSSSPSQSKDSARESFEAPPDLVMKDVNADEDADVDQVKQEDSTPRPLTEAGDTTADESVTGKHHASRLAKRKRRDSTPDPLQTPIQHDDALPSLDGLPPLPPTEVSWTRAFNKVSGSAMEQIVHHRSANMFAHPIREKDAPGYSKVILRPQDLKSIRAAIIHGNKAAAQAAASLPGGDPGTSTVRLPISEELVPPQGIINSSQLDRELAHMFSNAIMYNPDHFHGPGPSFLRQDDEDDAETAEGTAAENALGYKVDEFGVVKDARAMFVEVEKLVSELRSAEIQRARPALTAGTGTRPGSVAAGGNGEASVPRDDERSATEDVDEQTATEAENVGNTAKRRRTTRG